MASPKPDDPQPAQLPATREIWVQKHPDSPDGRVAIWDQDDAHPASRGNPRGELYIADRFPRLVAETPGVQQKLQRSQGGVPDLRTLREDEAQQITSEMEAEEEEERAVAEEEARLSLQASPAQGMPPNVAAYLANAGLVALPASAVSGQAGPQAASRQATPPRTATESAGSSSGDTAAGDDAGSHGRSPRSR